MMGEISDTIQRLHTEGNTIETIVAVVASMEAMKPKRKAKTTDDKATRLPKDWQLPRPWGMWAVEELGLSVDLIRREADKFRDYWCAKATNATKLDWMATYKNWMRRVAETTPTAVRNSTEPQNAIARRRAELAERIAREQGSRREGNRDSRSDRDMDAPLLLDIR